MSDRLIVQTGFGQLEIGPRNTRSGDILLALVVLANLAMLAFYEIVSYRVLFHSDAAAINLLAEEIVRSGHFFPPDWNYANGDLVVVFGHLFIIPLVPFVRNGFGLHALAGVLSAMIILASVWLLLRRIGMSRTGRLFLLAILTSGISPFLSENLFGQTSYGTVLYLLVLQLLFILSFFQARRDGHRRRALLALGALALLVFLTTLGNPSRGVATYIVPIFGSLILLRRLARASMISGELTSFFSARDLNLAGAITILSIAAGAIGHAAVLASVNNVMRAGDARLLDYDGIARNAVGALGGWLYLSGGLSEPGVRVLSIEGLYASIRLIASIATLALPYWVYRLATRGDGRLSFLAISSLVSLAIVLFFYLFTTVPGMATVAATNLSSRYFTVPLVLMLIVAGSSIDHYVAESGRSRGGMIALILFAAASLSIGFVDLVRPAFVTVPEEQPATYGIVPSRLDGVMAELQHQGLQYGYASYWNANVITVLSDSEQRVRPIEVAPTPRPTRHLSSNLWYRPTAWKGQTFLLLTNAEYEKLDWKLMARHLGAPDRVVPVDRRTIVVYSYNIAERLPGWNDDLSRPIVLPADAASLHQIGHLDETKQAMVGERGQSGFLVYGPYISLPAGRYHVTFEIDTDATDARIAGTVDAVAAGGTIALAKSDIVPAGKAQELGVTFDLDKKTEQVEFRVFQNGSSGVTLHRITVRRREDVAAAPIAPILPQR